jgi:hypothetical protein
LYEDPALREMMAATHAVVDGGARGRASAGGFAFPPYFVIQRGEPLDEWSERVAKVTCAGLDLVNVFQALWQVLVAPCADCTPCAVLAVHASIYQCALHPVDERRRQLLLRARVQSTATSTCCAGRVCLASTL